MARISTKIGLGVALLALCSMSVPVGVASAQGASDPLIDGLSGPLGLAVGSEGTVYVTEAFGPGHLTAISTNGSAEVLLTTPDGEIAGVDARGKGTLVYTRSMVAGEEAPPVDGSLDRLLPNGKTRRLASTEDYESDFNPDQINTYGLIGAGAACANQVNSSPLGPATYTGIVESHPYAVAIVPGGYLVADAAANAIYRVAANGATSTVAVLPPVANLVTQDFADFILDEFGVDVSDCVGETYYEEPVPTDVEVGPDGNYYVSTLPGSEAPGQGKIWRVDAHTGALDLVTDGLFTPVDIAVADDGTIYVAELFASQITIVVDGIVTGSIAADSPGAIEVGPDGTIYATTGVFGDGAVITVTP